MLKSPDIRPGFAPRMVFWLNGVRRDPGEAAVLDPKWRDAFLFGMCAPFMSDALGSAHRSDLTRH